MWGKPSNNLSFDVPEKEQPRNSQMSNNTIRKVKSAGLYGNKLDRTKSRTTYDG